MPKKRTKKTLVAKGRQKRSSSSLVNKYKKKLPFILLIIGIFLISGSLVWKSHAEKRYSFSTTIEAPHVTSPRIFPTYLLIEKIGLYRSINQTKIKDNIWEVKNDAISHLETSAAPGEAGNIILYSHNTPSLFGKLPELTRNDEITVVSQDGKKHLYRVTETYVVSPNDIWVIENTDKEELTLYTCYGFADLQRFVVKATPEN